ncbi:MAG TPA: dihydroorotate dehydrogenase electron transfer subunit [Nitrososphaerales archaeon]|nr:dihydroorotate dehydrogenase electron transfer subunit [Nitrososphaerales archaeon]
MLLTIDTVRSIRVERVVQESSNIRTFVFKDLLCESALPGQFLMVWLPGVGEFPMSVSLPYPRKMSSIAVKAMGEGSRALYEAKQGAILGVRGPYGNRFAVNRRFKRVLLVGGGTGMAPLITLARSLSSQSGLKVLTVIGAKTKEELPFLNETKKFLGSKNVYPTTDDGSLGFKGLVHEQVEELVEQRGFDMIYSCGPERMMLEVFRIAKNAKIPVQFSLERIMKCGMGICGSCTIGDVVLCKDGPVLNENELDRIGREFGHLHRDKTGKLCPI